MTLSLTKNVAALPVLQSPKSFAVFVASYNTTNNVVRGGVCGTVFFVSPTEAITAFHVLHASSLKPLPGFERVRVWLVHENYPAIEVKAEYLTSDQDRDLTRIHLGDHKKVAAEFVYGVDTVHGNLEKVETDGFKANTDGPRLVRRGLDVDIESVPVLQRLHLEGVVVRQARVNLKASDIDLKSSPNVELSYQPIIGISGGPVVAHGKVIAMNSFADPGTFKHTWALELTPGLSQNARP